MPGMPDASSAFEANSGTLEIIGFMALTIVVLLVLGFIVWYLLRITKIFPLKASNPFSSQAPELPAEYLHSPETRKKVIHALGWDPTPFAPRELLHLVLADPSSWTLIASNLVALGLAWQENAGLATLLAVYWFQSVIIGFFNAFKMLLAEGSEFKAVLGDSVLGKGIQWIGRLFFTGFFAFHYGLFHFVYAAFLGLEGLLAPAGNSEWLGFPGLFGPPNLEVVLPAAALFFSNHGYSFIHNRGTDKLKSPAQLMAAPYARIIPMHLTLIFGALLYVLGGPLLALGLFGLLKTAADVTMHVQEHAQATATQ